MRERRITATIAALAFLGAIGVAWATVQYPDGGTSPAPGQSIGSVVADCVNSSGQAVPLTSGNCNGTVPGSLPPTTIIQNQPQGQLPWNGATQATQIQGNNTGTTGAVVGTLAGTSSKTTFICDFDVSAIGGTAAVGPITVAGLLGGSKIYELASSASGITLEKSFSPCLAASAANTAITITTTADASATAVAVNSTGYQF